jgi:hypothetical protein
VGQKTKQANKQKKKSNCSTTVGIVDLCARAQIAGQEAVEGLAVSVGPETSKYKMNMPQQQARLYNGLAVE